MSKNGDNKKDIIYQASKIIYSNGKIIRKNYKSTSDTCDKILTERQEELNSLSN